MNPPTQANRDCPSCGSDRAELWMDKGALHLSNCGWCGMIYVRTLNQEYVDGSFYEAEAGPFYLSADKISGDYSPARYTREIRLLRRYLKRGRVLDVGCSTGGFLFHLNRTFPGAYEIFGMDLPSNATAHAQGRGVRILPGSFLDLEDHSFDAITFWAVLEHVPLPKEFLLQAERLLKPGGFCFALVPNIESLAVRILGPKYRYILPQHINYFSLETLARLVKSAGFEVAGKTTTHFNPIVIWKDRRSRIGLATDAERAQLLGKTNALKESAMLAPLRLVYAGVERALAAFSWADNAVVVGRRTRRS